MHEMSLVRSLLQLVDQVLAENHAATAKVIEIEIGPLSGVEPDLVRGAFEQLAIHSRWHETELVIAESCLVVECLECQSETELTDFVFRCDQCNSGKVQVIQGDQFRCLSVTIEEIDPALTEATTNRERSSA